MLITIIKPPMAETTLNLLDEVFKHEEGRKRKSSAVRVKLLQKKSSGTIIELSITQNGKLRKSQE